MQNDLISRSESYMNDLIRRKDVLALFPTNDCSDKMIGLYERILDIPIAYDVEKVVEDVRVDCCSMGFDESQIEIIVKDVRNGGKE